MKLNIAITCLYAGLLCLIYTSEIIVFWSYMRFVDDSSGGAYFLVVLISALLASLLPTEKSARAYIVTVLHYLFFIPSILYATFNHVHYHYLVSLFLVVVGVYVLSAVPVRAIAFKRIDRKSILSLCVVAIVSALYLQIAFGGLDKFNLNFSSVYEFRRDVSASMPFFLGYVFSNVTKALIPISIVLSIVLQSRLLLIFSILSSVLFFGMTHHKAILFTSIFVVGVYYAFCHLKRASLVAVLPVVAALLCLVEIAFLATMASERVPGAVTSYFVRRTLLVPPMLDASFVEFFSENARYYWSMSKLGFGIFDSPYSNSAPFLIGGEYFGRADMSANTGIIGSGYSNAGLVGVAIYSAFLGFLIAYINALGRQIGAEFAAAASLPTVLVVLTSTDVGTALLSHGLLLLIIILSVVPKSGRVLEMIRA